jgi:Uma2 family endonuclease
VHIGPHRRRVDRAIWAGLGRLPHEDETPTIAVEFVSEGRRNRQRDYQIKRDEYRSAGVREYWIFDRFARRLTVHRCARGKTTTKVVEESGTYTTPLLPGFELRLAALLALTDRWGG